MAGKDSTDVPRWQKLGNLPLRFALPRVFLATLIVSALLFLWNSHSQTEIQGQFQAPEEQQWDQNPVNYQDESLFEEPQRYSHTHGHANGLLPVDEAEEICADHGMKPYPKREQRRKVYDAFLVGTELSWVEIRLNELASEVDYFVILESEKTFTNKTKPKHFKNNWEHFSKFSSQIIYHLLDDSMIKDYGARDREHFSRNALINQIFPSLIGEQAPEMGDVIIISDVDEIPRPETVAKMRNCDIPERVGMEAKFYLYAFNLHNLDDPWNHPQATYWQGEKTLLPERLRLDATNYNFPNAAWHCTTCFSTVSEFVTKVKSSSDQEYNKPQYTNPDAIVRRVRNGTDLFDRAKHYQKIAQEDLDVPQYLLQNSQRFAYLLDRSPANANFRDYTPVIGGEFDLSDGLQ